MEASTETRGKEIERVCVCVRERRDSERYLEGRQQLKQKGERGERVIYLEATLKREEER